MTTPKERQGAISTIASGVYLTADNRYLVRVTFAPGGVFHEASIILDEDDDFNEALYVRTRLRELLIEHVAPVELLDQSGNSLGVVYNNKVNRIRPMRPVPTLPPPELFMDADE